MTDPSSTASRYPPIVPEPLIHAFALWDAAIPDTFTANAAMHDLHRRCVSYLQALPAAEQAALPDKLRAILRALDEDKRYGYQHRQTVQEAEFRAIGFVSDLVRRQQIAAQLPRATSRTVTPAADLPPTQKHSLVWLDTLDHPTPISAVLLANVRDSLGGDHVVIQILAAGNVRVLTMPLGDFRAAQARAQHA